MSTPILTEKPTREIKYNRFTKSYDAFLNDELVGSYDTYFLAEEALDQIVFNSLTKGQPVTEAIEDVRATRAESADIDADVAAERVAVFGDDTRPLELRILARHIFATAPDVDSETCYSLACDLWSFGKVAA